MTYEVTQSAGGTSSTVRLPKGYWAGFLSSASWGVAKIEVSDDGSAWYDAELYSGGANFTANKAFAMLGGLLYRINVTTYSAPVTLKCVPTLKMEVVPYQVQLPACG